VGLYRFTIAHELGHLAQHKYLRLDRFVDDAGCLSLSESFLSYLEVEANRFAAYFLMPSKDVFEELIRFFGLRGVNPDDYLAMLTFPTDRSLWWWKHRVLPFLTESFQVSLTAMMIRCRTLQVGTHTLLPAQLESEVLAPSGRLSTILQRMYYRRAVNS